MSKVRADILMVEQGLAESRAQAQRLILAGQVRAGTDHVVRKANDTFDPDSTQLTVDTPLGFVSRGAQKLLPALDKHLPRLDGAIGLDVGASTGGFTDLMLQRGAAKVYAVDVGTGQLHWKLRQDPRVVCMEQTNARYLNAEQVPDPIDVMTVDVSFISLRLVLPASAALLKPGAWAFTLIKPQFEAERSEIAKGGVVRDQAVRDRIVEGIQAFAGEVLRWETVDVIPSPILGPKGNQEYIAVFRPRA